MLSKISNRKIFLWSILIGSALSLIMFVSNWLVLIHRDETPTAIQLFDISFYYFIPLGSWAIITLIAIKYADLWIHSNEKLRSIIFKISMVIILSSPIVRIFDILADYSIKNLLGMISANPFQILNDVWLVVLFSSPTAAFKMLVILSVVCYYKLNRGKNKTLTIRTRDGAYHTIKKESISYLLADGNYLNIHAEGVEYRSRNTLKSLESILEEDFFRIHKSSIINWNHIKQLKHWRNGEYLIVMLDDKPLTSSKSYKAAISQIKSKMIVTGKVKDYPRSATVHPTIA
ncbi:LytTR family transcriptional regulator DNA-binding domain-containing protein [Ekhidna sp.]|uniref:LytTR family DNA-binding domain-containing protein n=1 Tax=Ekhidna sp. TaxID=2608089 RepID=UPI0032990577